MLSYNDALQHDQPASTECVVCKTLIQPDSLVWHTVGLTSGWTDTELLVPVCLDCLPAAEPPTVYNPEKWLANRSCERLDGRY